MGTTRAAMEARLNKMKRRLVEMQAEEVRAMANLTYQVKQMMKMKQKKKVKGNLQNTKKQVRKKYIPRRRLPVWEDDEDRWWRRRRRSSIEDWPPNVRAFFESQLGEEEEQDDDVDGEEEPDDVEPEETVIDHQLSLSDSIEMKETKSLSNGNPLEQPMSEVHSGEIDLCMNGVEATNGGKEIRQEEEDEGVGVKISQHFLRSDLMEMGKTVEEEEMGEVSFCHTPMNSVEEGEMVGGLAEGNAIKVGIGVEVDRHSPSEPPDLEAAESGDKITESSKMAAKFPPAEHQLSLTMEARPETAAKRSTIGGDKRDKKGEKNVTVEEFRAFSLLTHLPRPKPPEKDSGAVTGEPPPEPPKPPDPTATSTAAAAETTNARRKKQNGGKRMSVAKIRVSRSSGNSRLPLEPPDSMIEAIVVAEMGRSSILSDVIRKKGEEAAGSVSQVLGHYFDLLGQAQISGDSNWGSSESERVCDMKLLGRAQIEDWSTGEAYLLVTSISKAQKDEDAQAVCIFRIGLQELKPVSAQLLGVGVIYGSSSMNEILHLSPSKPDGERIEDDRKEEAGMVRDAIAVTAEQQKGVSKMTLSCLQLETLLEDCKAHLLAFQKNLKTESRSCNSVTGGMSPSLERSFSDATDETRKIRLLGRCQETKNAVIEHNGERDKQDVQGVKFYTPTVFSFAVIEVEFEFHKRGLEHFNFICKNSLNPLLLGLLKETGRIKFQRKGSETSCAIAKQNGDRNMEDALSLLGVSYKIKRNLMRLNANAVDCKFQKGLLDCINKLTQAGILIWAVIGGKMETTIKGGSAYSQPTQRLQQMIIYLETPSIQAQMGGDEASMLCEQENYLLLISENRGRLGSRLGSDPWDPGGQLNNASSLYLFFKIWDPGEIFLKHYGFSFLHITLRTR